MTDPALAHDRHKRVEAEMHHWIVSARRMVHDDFTGNETELQRLVMQAASAMMMQDRLAQIQDSLDEIKTALHQRDGR
ncbi:hypothetical protein [Cognatiyoonia sp. IB215182]|uniref:hypothetical protein n=1 Tax=Cognatiyoonia sp. IB215182 TaxID=3097353 RepID=UPI002A0EB6B1|nr:hypothetical protein [Cognatiyoonia sp. IB215182]MDX8351474.1 hypothetical protein [Cognatiyoonia sp. IB215182]